jgi:hypothetical protein
VVEPEKRGKLMSTRYSQAETLKGISMSAVVETLKDISMSFELESWKMFIFLASGEFLI